MNNSRQAGSGRRVVATAFVTLDGYMVGPDEDISWVIEDFDPAMADDIAEDMTRWDMFVFGRVTYEIFAGYWPHAQPYQEGDRLNPAAGREDPRIIRALNERPKLVFSRTLTSADWQHTRVVGGAPEEEIRGLTREPGGVINIQGSASIVQALARADLIDEYRLYVHPVLLSSGKRLYATGAGRQDFRLAQLKQYDNGVVGASYRRGRGQEGER